MRKSSSIMLIGVIALSFLASIQPTLANYSVDVYINNVNYSDLDTDGLQDDIRMDLSITLSNSYVYTDVEVYVGVTLPSGAEFWFYYNFTAKKYTYSASVDMQWDLMNTALEKGWYTASAVGFAQGESFSYMHSIPFDPPGEVDGRDPNAFVAFM